MLLFAGHYTSLESLLMSSDVDLSPFELEIGWHTNYSCPGNVRTNFASVGTSDILVFEKNLV